jgi:hypothetical protein
MPASRSRRAAAGKKMKIIDPVEHQSQNKNNGGSDANKAMNLRGRSSRFPSKLFEMVENAECQGYDHIVSWTIDEKGKHGFAVHNTNLLSEQVLGKYFDSSNFRTLQRQLSYWSFERMQGVYSKKNPKVTYRHSSGLFRKGDKALVECITRRENKKNSTRKQGITINLKHCFATEADYAIQSLERAEGMALDYMQGICITNSKSSTKDHQVSASSTMKQDAADQPHDLLFVDHHSNNSSMISSEQEEEPPDVRHVVSSDENKCTAAELFDADEQEEEYGVILSSNNYGVPLGTNENTTNNCNYHAAGATADGGCPRRVSTVSPTSSRMTYSDNNDELSSSTTSRQHHHVHQLAADFEQNRPAIHQTTAAVSWPQQQQLLQLGQTGISSSVEEGRVFLLSLQKQVEDFVRKSAAPLAHRQPQPTTHTRCQPTTEDSRPHAGKEEKGSPEADTMLTMTLNSLYSSLQQAECEISRLRYSTMEPTNGNVLIEREEAHFAAAPPAHRLPALHHQEGPRPPFHQEPTTIHFPARLHHHDYYEQQQQHSENFRSPPQATCGEEQEQLEPLSAEEDNDAYWTTTNQAAPAAVLLNMLNSGGNAAPTRVEAV